VTLPDIERACLCNVLAQLPPDLRPVFVERVAQALSTHLDPGPGDIDRALRAALFGLWTPPAITELRPSRWDRAAPAFDRTPKRAGKATCPGPAQRRFWAGTILRNIDFIGITCMPSNLQPYSEQFRSAPRTCRQVCARLSLRPIDQLGRCYGGRTMPTPEDYKQMADRCAQLAIACSAPSIAQTLLALGLDYMALAARPGQPVEVQQDPAGFGD
jgi:hypothetical protein